MYLLRIMVLAGVGLALITQCLTAQEALPVKESQARYFIDPDESLVNYNINNSKHSQSFQAMQYEIVDSLANAYSFYTNDQKPFVYDIETGTLIMIKRGFSEDNSGTEDDPFNTKNNLYIRKSTDWGKTWSEPELVYNSLEENFGPARYPSIDPFYFDDELNGTFIAPYFANDSWSGFICGLYLPGSISTQQLEQFEQDGNTYYWETTDTKMIADLNSDDFPFSLTMSIPRLPKEERDGTNQSNIGLVEPIEQFNRWSGRIPEEWSSEVFAPISQETKDSAPIGVNETDWRDFTTSTMINLQYLGDGLVYAGVRGRPQSDFYEKFTCAFSFSTDYGQTWSEFNFYDLQAVIDYGLVNGAIDSDLNLGVQDFNAYDNGDVSFLCNLTDFNGDNQDNHFAEYIEVFYEDGSWGFRKISDTQGFVLTYLANEPGEQRSNQRGKEAQLVKTADGTKLLAKWIDYYDIQDPETEENIPYGGRDVFVALRDINSGEWSDTLNVTKTFGIDKITWLPDYIPNNLKDIPLLQLVNIDENESALELEIPHYVLIGHFDADQLLSVENQVKSEGAGIQGIYPNPADDRATIAINLTNSGHVKLEVFNNYGVKVGTVMNEYVSGGITSVEVDASEFLSGVYHCVMTVNNKKVTKKFNVIH